MSRSTVAKSRADKGGKTASAPTPAVTHEIVPGKFNDQDWNLMQDHDDGDEFIEDIVEDVCNTAVDIIYNSYIQRQLIPYTVLQAKDAILQIIEWQFLARDDGDNNVDTDPGWLEEEEPEPALTDCWAQGSVPRTLQVTPRPETIQEEEEIKESSVAEEEVEPEAQPQLETQEPVEEPPQLQKEETMVEVTEQTHESETVQTIEEPQQQKSKTPSPVQQETKEEKKRSTPKKYKKHRGPLKSPSIKKMTESLEDTEINMYLDEYYASMPPAGSPDLQMMQMPTSCHSILKLQNGRPPGNRDVLYDDHGNVVSVVRIDPERLPSHSVNTKYRIMEQGQESKNNRIQTRHKVVDPDVEAAQARLEAMRTGKFIKKQKAPKPPHEPKPTGRHARTSLTRGFQESTLPPPLIENMEVSPGVVVREGDRVKKGPKQRTKEMDLISAATKRGLKPVSKSASIELVRLAEILDSQSIMVKPLADSPVIPPIAQM